MIAEPTVKSATITLRPKSGALESIERLVPLGVWLLVVITLLSIPGKIIGYGYIPHDDALRHVAKAVSGKAWPEILLVRSDYTLDLHQGWHAILGTLHHWFHLNAESLLVISIMGLMCLVSAAVLPWFRRPESWLAGLLAITLCNPDLTNRLSMGRPFLLMMAVWITLLFLWSRVENRNPTKAEIFISVLLIGISSWVHGGWYQLSLPIGAFVLCGRWKTAVYYGLCWIAGSVLGFLMTGHPVQFFRESLTFLIGVFGDFHVDRQLVTELLPSGGDPLVAFAIIGMILWRSRAPGWTGRELLTPQFMLVVMGWLLGLRMQRFWTDWGLPATAVWLAIEAQKEFERATAFESWKRLVLTGALSFGVYFAMAADLSNRYTWNLTNEYINQNDENLKGWLPENNGIFYCTDMGFFYQTFYKNPTANWRYALGFEPAMMEPEDLNVYRRAQWNYGDVRAYQPWINKMTANDRLAITSGWLKGGGPPNIPQLEWKYAVSGLWIGRLPRHH